MLLTSGLNQKPQALLLFRISLYLLSYIGLESWHGAGKGDGTRNNFKQFLRTVLSILLSPQERQQGTFSEEQHPSTCSLANQWPGEPRG